MVSRIVVAAPSSGQGKTTVATGLMAALRARGMVVAPFKVGPDYIDPGYHSLATGRPGRNLDPFLCGEGRIGPLFAHGAAGADVAVVEGVMGLFDGRLGGGGFGSTAHVARLLDAPVVLVVDARHTSRTVGAVALGMARFDPSLRVAGVVLNQVGSARHEAEARAAVEGVGLPVLGALPRALDIEAPSRHLGLVPVAERDDAKVAAMGEVVAAHVDLDAVLGVAAQAGHLFVEPWDPAAEVRAPSGPVTLRDGGGASSADGVASSDSGDGSDEGALPVVAVAGGRAFTFRYPETDELLAAAGCRVVEFDPLQDEALPSGAAGLWLGGGFPEVYAGELAANEALSAEIRDAVAAGMPTVAECAGLLYLCHSLDGKPMAGAVPAVAAMGPRLTMGYRVATVDRPTLLGRPGEEVTGHEFHRTTVRPAGGNPANEGVAVGSAGGAGPRGEESTGAAWSLDGRLDGVASDTLHASYLHVHWAGHPLLAQRFADAVHAFGEGGGVSTRGGESSRTTMSVADADVDPIELRKPPSRARVAGVIGGDIDLLHHGDRDIAPGLVDLAVNVRVPSTPRWLVDAIIGDGDLAPYPDATPAREAIAAHHRVDPAMVLPVAGVAEAFTLIARAIPGDATVIHPQFTEPEAALRAAGRAPRRHLLGRRDGFRLVPSLVQPSDLAIVGNPTNPTGVLHPAADLLALPARTLVVDEAFMDAIPGEPETLIAPTMPGRLVLRSLTKTWGLAGLRIGYVVGDPALVAALEAQQPPWSVSSPAIRAAVACTSRRAADEAARLAEESAGLRDDLDAALAAIGIRGVPGRAPFVLADTSAVSPGSLREPLARLGFAVRRGETFPGLGPTWLRFAVRTSAVHRDLAAAIASLAGDR